MRHGLILALALATCACWEPHSAGEDAATQAGSASPVSAGPTIGGDGSAIDLTRISAADIDEARLPGELACSFTSSSGDPLLFARGNVASPEPALGVVNVGGYVERVGARGGFDGMFRGASFTGRGKTVRIDLTADEPVGGGESPPYPATLTYQRADGASRTWHGLWTCGP